jgi:peptidyl-prolyl cis-trans isomerase SurA
MKRYVLITLLFALLSAGVAAQASKSRAVEADRVVAVVNSEAITLFELRTKLAMVERQLRNQNVQLPSRDVLERQLLERMIIDRAQMQMAKETGLQVSDGEVDGAVRRIAESNRMNLEQFRSALEKDGVEWNKFREEVRQEMTLVRLRDREVDNRLSISEDEIDGYLEEMARSGGNGNIVQVAHIIVRVPEQANAAQIERSRARAQQAVEQLKTGEDFGRVAAVFSDASDGLAGGVMEARPLDRLPALYAEAVKKLSPGETSTILRSPAGFHIVRLINRQGGSAQLQALKQTRARHILIKVNELLSDADAKQRALVLKERLDNGVDFTELARQHSTDMSAAKGGDLGWLYQGDTVPEFERAMDALKIGDTSEPVRSPFGWHIIQVQERRTQDASTERQRLMARQALRERKSDEAYQDWLRQLRDRTYVEYRLEEK